MEEKKQYDLEEQLIDFALRIVKVAEALPSTKIGNHLSGQIGRSGTSPALNYSDAQAAESRADFVHEMKVCLKELRETRICLIIISRADLILPPTKLEPLTQEAEELIATFAKSIDTAKQNGKSR